MTSGKNNSWISFLVPKMAFLSQLAGRKERAVFILRALLGVLEVRGLYLQVLQKAAVFSTPRSTGNGAPGAVGYPCSRVPLHSWGRGRNPSHAVWLRDIWHYCSFFLKKRKYRKKAESTLSQQLLLCYWACKSDSCSFNIFIVLNMTQNIYYKLRYLHNIVKFST